MKKLVAMVLVLVCCLSFGTVHAAEYDLSVLSMQELLVLQKQVDKEIVSRLNETVAEAVGEFVGGELMPSGKYVVGKGIRAGIYDVMVIHETSHNFSYGGIDIYSLRDGKYSEHEQHEYAYVGNLFRFVLDEGMRLDIDNCVVLIRPVEKPSWMP